MSASQPFHTSFNPLPGCLGLRGFPSIRCHFTNNNMTNIEQAVILRDKLSRELSGPEMIICEFVRDGEELTKEQRLWFDSLKTQFAREIAQSAP